MRSSDNQSILCSKTTNKQKQRSLALQSVRCVEENKGILARLSHLVSQILTPVADKLNEEAGTECASTEEMIRAIQDANQQVQREASTRLETSDRRRDLVAVSQDVKALYPSLDWDVVVEIVGKLIEEI